MIRQRTDTARGRAQRAAAPGGGATTWVWGCILVLLPLAEAAADTPLIPVPSGQPIELSEVLVDTVGTQSWVRFRFLAPQIARNSGTVTYADAGPDIEALCADVALPYLSEWQITADRIVVSLSDRAVPFGQADPAATQFFEEFTIEDGTCIWEEF